MRNPLLIIAIASFVTTCSVIFYKRFRSDNIEVSTKTEINVPKTIIDLGDRPINSSALGRYVIYNIGKQNLNIQNVEPDCHCTVGEYTHDPIKPADSTVIILRYDSTRLGVFQSTAKVETNSDLTPLMIVLRGNMVINPSEKEKSNK